MEQNSTDFIIKTENLINAVQNEPSIWNSELNSSEEEKELAWTRIAGDSKLSLPLSFRVVSLTCECTVLYFIFIN